MQNSTLLIILFIIVLSLIFNYIQKSKINKSNHKIINKYIHILNKIISINKNGIIAMEYDDRYTISYNVKGLDIDMVRLLKNNKQLIIDDKSVNLTEKEYKTILETIKTVL